MRICIFGASGGIGSALTERLAQQDRVKGIHAGARRALNLDHEKVSSFAFDLLDEGSIAAAAREIEKDGPLDLVIVATGVLQTVDLRPERTWRALNAAEMQQAFSLNAIGPAMIGKHILPLLHRDRRAVFAALSARVGSIADNRLGGWHSYRASKAALNQLVRNFAIELARKNPEAIAVTLHPGTVDTDLSRPFQPGLPSGQLVSPQESAENLLKVIDRLGPGDSGKLIAWDGSQIPF